MSSVITCCIASPTLTGFDAVNRTWCGGIPTYGQIEHQANVFAANFLMPLDDFRRQIAPSAKIDLDMICHCADRYRVSLIAPHCDGSAIPKAGCPRRVSGWLYPLGALQRARLQSGAYFKTSAGPVEIPSASLPANQDLLVDGRAVIDHGAGIWFRESVREMTIFAEQHDFALSLLILDDSAPYLSLEDEPEPDTYDKMMPEQRRREW